MDISQKHGVSAILRRDGFGTQVREEIQNGVILEARHVSNSNSSELFV